MLFAPQRMRDSTQTAVYTLPRISSDFRAESSLALLVVTGGVIIDHGYPLHPAFINFVRQKCVWQCQSRKMPMAC